MPRASPPKAAPDVDISDAARILAEQAQKREDKFRDSWEAESKKDDVLNRKFEEALAAGDLALARSAFVEAQSELMRAVGKGVMHKNTGSRKVSRLAAQLKKLQAA